MKSILFFVLLLMSTHVYGQDTIRTLSEEVIVAKVVEVSQSEIIYKKFTNQDGPVYKLNKEDVVCITYKNGEKEFYNRHAATDATTLSETDLFDALTKKGNKVFIDSENANAVIHATNAIYAWGYWAIAKDKKEADFILNFNIRFGGLGDAFGSASFINPQNGKVIKATKEVNTLTSWDVNTKRGVINKIVSKEIRPLFYDNQ